jgi:hypothetical protein
LRDKRKTERIFLAQGWVLLEAAAQVRPQLEISLNGKEFIALTTHLNIKMRHHEPENWPLSPRRSDLLPLAKRPIGRYNPHNIKELNTVRKAVKFNLVLSIIL